MESVKINNEKSDKSQLLESLFFPVLFVVIIILSKVIENVYGFSFVTFGIYPKSVSGLKGIIFSPLIHGDYTHLFNNSVPLLLLGSALFYFYKEVAFQVFFWIWLISGLWIWAAARESYHIGASGIIYGLVSFLFVSGVLRRDGKLLAISMLVTFLYGSLVWGIFPDKQEISWEAHLFGLIAGLICAIIYRKHGPQKMHYEWENESDDDETPPKVEDHNYNPIEEEEETSDTEIPSIPESDPEKGKIINITYTYVKKKDGGEAAD